MIDREKFKALAKEREALEGANKDRIAAFDLRAQDAGIDPAGLKRFVAWKRQDEQRRAQKEAIDQQCRYLAGERDTPAELPIGCELAQAINLYRRNMTVRQVAEELHISSGKAGKLRELARMFDVHVHGRVDKPKAKKPPTVVTPPEVAALPAHNVETGEITETAPDTPPSPAPEFGVGPGTNPAPRYFASSAEQPVSNAADVPTREDGRAGERDPDSQTPEIAQPAGVKANNDGILGTDSLSRPATPQDTWDDIVRDHPTFLRRSA